MSLYIRESDDELFRNAALLVIRQQLGAISFVQRHLEISLKESSDLVRRMRTRGIVGYTTGSMAAPVLVKECCRCGRIGRQSFLEEEDPENFRTVTRCAVDTACLKRRKRRTDEDR